MKFPNDQSNQISSSNISNEELSQTFHSNKSNSSNELNDINVPPLIRNPNLVQIPKFYSNYPQEFYKNLKPFYLENIKTPLGYFYLGISNPQVIQGTVIKDPDAVKVEKTSEEREKVQFN